MTAEPLAAATGRSAFDATRVLGPLGERFAAAGLPTPIYEDAQPRTFESSRYDSAVGRFTHAIVADHAVAAQTSTATEIRALVRESVRQVVVGRELGRLDRIRARVTGMSLQYLTTYTPPLPVTFLGAEHPVSGLGRADLAWRHPALGVWFDEIKTWRHTQEVLDMATSDQVYRYLNYGMEQWPGRFAGVRVLTLGHSHACLWLSPEGLIEPLSDARISPAALASPVVPTQRWSA